VQKFNILSPFRGHRTNNPDRHIFGKLSPRWFYAAILNHLKVLKL